MRYANEVIVKQLQSDQTLRREHLRDAINSLFTEDYRASLLMIRDIINATCGFPTIAREIGANEKSVMQMLSDKGNPSSEKLLGILRYLIDQEGGEIKCQIKAAS